MQATNRIPAALIALALLAGLAALGLAAVPAITGDEMIAAADPAAPGLISYQGYLSDEEGAPLEGPVDLEFSLYPSADSDSAVWSESQNNVPLADGYFHILLGSTIPLSASHFSDPERYLQVSVDDGTGAVVLPRQRLGSAPYALQADSARQAATAPWSGLIGVPAGFADNNDGVEYAQVIAVAKSGGDFTSIQAAIDSVTDASSTNRYLVWVGPGRYNEQVTLKPNVYLQGVEQWGTVIESAASSGQEVPDSATLILSANTRVRSLAVLNTGTGTFNTAILVPPETSRTMLSDVYAEARGVGDTNYGVAVVGPNTDLAIERVSIGAANASNNNVGYFNTDGARVTARDASFWAWGGSIATAIVNDGNNSEIHALDVVAEGNGATDNNAGLSNSTGARATLRGGLYTGREGEVQACGICNYNGYVAATEVETEGNSTAGVGYGLLNDTGSADLQGGRFHAGGNDSADAIAIFNNSSESAFAPSLVARDVFAAVGGSNNCYAVRNEAGGVAAVVGGEFWAALCNSANYGAYNTGSGSTLEINNALISAKGGSDYFYGLYAGAESVTQISNSELRGDTYAFNSQGGMGYLRFVHLNGPVNGDTSKLNCHAVSQGGTFYPNTCPEVP